jgi:hypothetical protein
MPRRVALLLVVSALMAASVLGAKAQSPSSSLSWPTNQALPHFAAPQHLDVADVSSLPGDQQLLFNTLEGLVNRVQPRIYLLWAADEGNRTWLDTLNTEFGVPFTDRGSTWDTLSTYLLGTYGSSISGMIVYDPSVPDSINVATTLAGVDNAVVASPALATTLAAPPFNLKVVDDLRGKFLSRLDAYLWEYQNLWVPQKVTHRMLVGLPPFQSPSVHLADLGAINVPFEPVYDSGALAGEPFASLRDYSVAAGAMVVWLDHNEPAERVLLEKILSGMPPDSPYLGTHPGDVVGEITIVALLSQHSVYEVAADFFNNGSVFGGVRPPVTPAPAPPPAPPLDPKKIYVTFTMSDGDNIQYDQRKLRSEWDNSARGAVPINWTISPLLLDAAPAIFDHYTRSATPNDLFMAGPSGAGYAYPSSWPDKTFPTFTGQTGTYMQQAGITTLDILNAPDGIRMPLTQTDAHDYVKDVGPAGMMVNYYFFHECRTDNVFIAGKTPTPVTTGCVVSSSGKNAQGEAKNAQGEAEFDVFQQAQRCPAGQPCFISIEFIVWNVTPQDVAAVRDTLAQQDPRYVFVRADQYFDLLRQASKPSLK